MNKESTPAKTRFRLKNLSRRKYLSLSLHSNSDSDQTPFFSNLDNTVISNTIIENDYIGNDKVIKNSNLNPTKFINTQNDR